MTSGKMPFYSIKFAHQKAVTNMSHQCNRKSPTWQFLFEQYLLKMGQTVFFTLANLPTTDYADG